MKKPKSKDEPLASEAGRTWLQAEIANTERDLADGPNGEGWRSNETLRPALEERAAFLRALTALLD